MLIGNEKKILANSEEYKLLMVLSSMIYYDKKKKNMVSISSGIKYWFLTPLHDAHGSLQRTVDIVLMSEIYSMLQLSEHC